MNRPTVHFSDDSLRKVGDSNPRYGNPHGSLANCWFQPLTQPSSRKSLPNQQASFSNAVAKVLLFSGSTKFFSDYFSIKMHFFCNPLIFRTPFFWLFFFENAVSCKNAEKSAKSAELYASVKRVWKAYDWDYKHILFYEKIKKGRFPTWEICLFKRKGSLDDVMKLRMSVTFESSPLL